MLKFIYVLILKSALWVGIKKPQCANTGVFAFLNFIKCCN